MYRVFFLTKGDHPISMHNVHMCIANARRAYKNIRLVENTEELNDNDYLAISFCEFIAVGSDGKTIEEVTKKFAHRPMVCAALAALESLGVRSFAVHAYGEIKRA